MGKTIWCNNGECGFNSRITDEPGEGEECLYHGDLTLTVQLPLDEYARDIMRCDSFQLESLVEKPADPIPETPAPVALEPRKVGHTRPSDWRNRIINSQGR